MLKTTRFHILNINFFLNNFSYYCYECSIEYHIILKNC